MKAQMVTEFCSKETVSKQVKPWTIRFLLSIFILMASAMPALASGGGDETLHMT